MCRGSHGSESRVETSSLADRLRLIRLDGFGDSGLSDLASELGLPEGVWLTYETGTPIPTTVLLEFLDITWTDPGWLLTGEGPRYRNLENP